MSDKPQDPPADEVVGTVAEEAAKLFGALSDWAQHESADTAAAFTGLAAGVAGMARDFNEHIATGAPECTYCPICRTVHVVRSCSPEVKAHLTTAALSFMQAVAGMLATSVPTKERPDPSASVHKIQFDEGDD